MTILEPEVTPNRRGARSREAVLDAAERVMAEHGYAGATMALIVEEAGIPASSIYHYFGNKDGVLSAVMQRGANRFFAAIPDLETLIGTPREHLELAIAALQAALGANPDFLRLLIVMATQPSSSLADDALQVVRDVRKDARRRLRAQYHLIGGPGQDDATVTNLVTFTLALIDGVFIATQADPTVDLAAILTLLADAIFTLAGVTP